MRQQEEKKIMNSCQMFLIKARHHQSLRYFTSTSVQMWIQRCGRPAATITSTCSFLFTPTERSTLSSPRRNLNLFRVGDTLPMLYFHFSDNSEQQDPLSLYFTFDSFRCEREFSASGSGGILHVEIDSVGINAARNTFSALFCPALAQRTSSCTAGVSAAGQTNSAFVILEEIAGRLEIKCL